jgi:hypothetical protein
MIKIYQFAVVLHGCEAWSLILRKEHTLKGAEENIWKQEG